MLLTNSSFSVSYSNIPKVIGETVCNFIRPLNTVPTSDIGIVTLVWKGKKWFKYLTS